MFKSRRAAIGKCKDSRQFADRGGNKRFKLEGNSNITSKRVTIPPGFLCLGVKSNSVRKCQSKENFDSDRDYILTEDLHGLFNNNLDESFRKPRRSSRISSKAQDTEKYDSLTASEYYSKDLNRNRRAKNKHEVIPRPNKPIVRNNSKSLFRKINERCARARAKKSTKFNYPVSAVIDPSSKVERFHPTSFSLNLIKDIRVDLSQNDYLLQSKLAIRDKIRYINETLCGKMNPDHTTPEKNEKMQVNNDAAQPDDFAYVPKCEWIFETPPRQRVVLPKVDECAIQPAVIHTTKKQSNIYELNPNLRVDLTSYVNRQNVEVDGRYMRHLASFEEEMDVDVNVGMGSVEPRGVSRSQVNLEGGCSYFESERGEGREFAFPNPTSTLSQHFTQVTCRPSKTVKKLSRVSNFYSRKSEEDVDGTPMGVNLFQSIEEFERDFTFVEDEGGYKIVNTQGSADHFNFKFRKNLFKDSERLFSFEDEESKMFDFAQLRDD